MPSATITSLYKVTPFNMNFPFYHLQEEVPGKAIVASQFAYLRIPDDYLDSSVLSASEIWDSCL